MNLAVKCKQALTVNPDTDWLETPGTLPSGSRLLPHLRSQDQRHLLRCSPSPYHSGPASAILLLGSFLASANGPVPSYSDSPAEYELREGGKTWQSRLALQGPSPSGPARATGHGASLTGPPRVSQNGKLSLGDPPGRCRKPRAAAGPEGAPGGRTPAPRRLQPSTPPEGTATRPPHASPAPRPPPPQSPLCAGALGPLGARPPLPKPQTVAFCPVRTSRRFRRLATPRRRQPRHTTGMGAFPLAQARGRGGASAGNARDGRSPRSPGMPGAAGGLAHCVLEMEVLLAARSRWPAPCAPLGNAVYNLLNPFLWSVLYPSKP